MCQSGFKELKTCCSNKNLRELKLHGNPEKIDSSCQVANLAGTSQKQQLRIKHQRLMASIRIDSKSSLLKKATIQIIPSAFSNSSLMIGLCREQRPLVVHVAPVGVEHTCADANASPPPV